MKDFVPLYLNQVMKLMKRACKFYILFLLLVTPSLVARDLPGCHDRLSRSLPESEGVSSDSILRFVNRIDSTVTELHSLMILRHGKVIAEGWWHPYRPQLKHIQYSVSKTFVSAAVGFAVQEGLLSIDDPVISFFPGHLPSEISPALKKLTVRHLLTMSSGHEPPPVFTLSDGNWVRSYLSRPFKELPGKKFVYSTYDTYMLSAIIQHVSGESLVDFLRPRLFEPLEFSGVLWEKDSRGINSGGWGMQITTADMAKLGQFYLQKGEWKGKQLLNSAWIDESSSPQIFQKPHRTSEANSGDEGAQGYGYQIWRGSHNTFRADGAYGQYIVVIPEKEAVVAVTARIGKGSIWKPLWNILLPGMQEGALVGNESGNRLLNERLTSLRTKDPLVVTEPNVPNSAGDSRYRMDQNPLQIGSIAFCFDDGEGCTMSLFVGTDRYDLPFGKTCWRYGETERPGPYYASTRRNRDGMSPFPVAGFGTGSGEGELNLCLLYLTDSEKEFFSCRFEGEDLTVTITDSQSRSKRPVVLRGKRLP